jgi:hypothetical protein
MKEMALGQVKAWYTAAECAAESARTAITVARDLGCSWDEIGEATGMSRQAAHKRFGRLIGESKLTMIKAATDGAGSDGDGASPT